MSQIDYLVKPGGQLTGEFRVPGDKSISHRSIMFGAIADGTTHVTGFLQGEDSLNTLRAFRAMGVEIEGPNDKGEVTIHGVGIDGLKKPSKDIDLGNSGTSIRLMSGLLSGQTFDVVLSGDRSLSKRPMKRVTDPLALMGAIVDTDEGGRPPLRINGGSTIKGIDYVMPMASAQVKSCVLLAGMYAEGKTCVTEPATTRDHTERMLNAFGYPVETTGNKMCIEGGARLTACDIDVPSDISSAAFYMVGGSIAENSDITLQHVGVNPTRTGVIDILKLMGANIELLNERIVGGEPVADIRIQSAKLKGINVPESLVPLAIDEFPVLFVAAACAEGQTVITGAEELRVKESDRIQVMADGLQAIGVDAEATPDGMIINGGPVKGGKVHSRDDHRIAMAFTMAGLRSESDIIIEDCENVNTSFPDFIGIANKAGIAVSVCS
ncbi:MAG: 3-phosphoshikimate 1-carboxyvinyltransferase [endosymbiont of Galathealinum brachiosum]|uniref:3-phosphoshikimate 1-carboxyvinyltransferase n=1 Tax=endosymbiont of Galathealinum brachiosum TaxID=2200906 RepID=A0A370DGA9_9GAMM|nr:MAG: 3-phosphoshikimate 1-carboxyvinyltransferase [endosymbiont of Galathealinum brachiosum]